MDTLAKRLTAIMEIRGLSQVQLANLASTKDVRVSQQVIQHLASGRNLHSKYTPAIAEALGVSLKWLMSGEGEWTISDEELMDRIGRLRGEQRARALSILQGDGAPPRSAPAQNRPKHQN